jgi:hypothetical protein
MSRSAQVMRRPRRARRPAARPAAAIIAMAALALLVAACGGSPSSKGSGGSTNSGGSGTSRSTSSQAVAYAHCMRSHAVPNYPDPEPGRTLPDGLPKVGPRQLGVSSSRYQAALQACHRLLPTGGSFAQQATECMQNNDCPPALVQQILTADRTLARCMRTHGVPNFPDPTTDGGSGGPYFPISTAGISESASRTPTFVHELNECARVAGPDALEAFG